MAQSTNLDHHPSAQTTSPAIQERSRTVVSNRGDRAGRSFRVGAYHARWGLWSGKLGWLFCNNPTTMQNINEWGNEELRQLLFQKYPSQHRVIFTIHENTVRILNIRHSVRRYLHEE